MQILDELRERGSEFGEPDGEATMLALVLQLEMATRVLEDHGLSLEEAAAQSRSRFPADCGDAGTATDCSVGAHSKTHQLVFQPPRGVWLHVLRAF
jgi:hypothetical protein